MRMSRLFISSIAARPNNPQGTYSGDNCSGADQGLVIGGRNTWHSTTTGGYSQSRKRTALHSRQCRAAFAVAGGRAARGGSRDEIPGDGGLARVRSRSGASHLYHEETGISSQKETDMADTKTRHRQTIPSSVGRAGKRGGDTRRQSSDHAVSAKGLSHGASASAGDTRALLDPFTPVVTNPKHRHTDDCTGAEEILFEVP